MSGPKLPRKLFHLTLVATSQGTYAIGGGDEDMKSRNEVLQLDCQGEQIQSCVWKEVGNLQYARSKHVSIPVPELFSYCDVLVESDYYDIRLLKGLEMRRLYLDRKLYEDENEWIITEDGDILPW